MLLPPEASPAANEDAVLALLPPAELLPAVLKALVLVLPCAAADLVLPEAFEAKAEAVCALPDAPPVELPAPAELPAPILCAAPAAELLAAELPVLPLPEADVDAPELPAAEPLAPPLPETDPPAELPDELPPDAATDAWPLANAPLTPCVALEAADLKADAAKPAAPLIAPAAPPAPGPPAVEPAVAAPASAAPALAALLPVDIAILPMPAPAEPPAAAPAKPATAVPAAVPAESVGAPVIRPAAMPGACQHKRQRAKGPSMDDKTAPGVGSPFVKETVIEFIIPEDKPYTAPSIISFVP